MSQNPQNSVIVTGHSNGTVNLWTPNYSGEPVVKLLAHPNVVNHVVVDMKGNYITTTGVDKKMRVWDLRNTYSQVFDYYTPSLVQSLSISQRGLLAVGSSSIVEIWKDHSVQKQQKPYLKHHFNNKQTYASSLKFINFEDFLGIGTNFGYSQILVPGSGEPNFDTYENNPYETKNQKRNSEVHKLLEKIPYTMIHLQGEALVNSIDHNSKNVKNQLTKNEIKEKSEALFKSERKKKMRLSNKEKHHEILKNFDKAQAKRNRLRAMMEINHGKIQNEKAIVKDELKVLKKIDENDDFDPEMYLNEDDNNADNDYSDDY